MKAGDRIEIYEYRDNQYIGFNHFFPLVHLHGTELWIPEEEVKFMGYLVIKEVKK